MRLPLAAIMAPIGSWTALDLLMFCNAAHVDSRPCCASHRSAAPTSAIRPPSPSFDAWHRLEHIKATMAAVASLRCSLSAVVARRPQVGPVRTCVDRR